MVLLPLASLLDRALGLDESISMTGENTALGWEHPLPGWLWIAIILSAFAIASASYSRMLGPRWLRGTLALIRGCVLLVLALLLAGPTLVRSESTADPDWLLVLVDRSASMQFEDIEVDGRAMSRDDALRAAIKSQADVFDENHLGKNRQIIWLGFDAQSYPIEPPQASAELGDILPEANASATNLRTAIDQAIQLASGRAISGIVLLTEGQSSQPTSNAYAEQLSHQGVVVYPVPLGSDRARLDLTISRVDYPPSVFEGDVVPVTVTISRQDILAGVVDAASIHLADVEVRLVDSDTLEVVDRRTLEDVGFDAPLLLQAQHDAVSAMNLRIEVAYIGEDEALGALLEEISMNNNVQEVGIDLIDRPIRVLYVEGTARWEYRFLLSMLKREQSIDSSVMLVDADRAFVQEGNTPIARFPRTPEELGQYDVIIIGDVRPRFFSDDQVAMIKDHVAARGAGLLWIGGPRFTPNYYEGSGFELLLPMLKPGSVNRLTVGDSDEFFIAPSDTARELNLLRLSMDTNESDQEGWPSNLPPFYWMQDLGQLRPGASPLAEVLGTGGGDGQLPKAAAALYRFGSGEVIYVGTDETWRWRRAGGEVYYEQFWIQLIRKLGRQRVVRGDDRAHLSIEPATVDLGWDQIVQLTIDDPALIRMAPALIRAEIEEVTDEGNLLIEEIFLRQADASNTSPGASPRLTYQAVWQSQASGRFELRVVEPLLDPVGLIATAQVNDPSQELARAATDHPRLITLAKITGGQVIELNNLAQLEDLIPDLSRDITTQTRRPLTNTMFALLVILAFLTLEWVLRRVARFV